MTTVTHRSRSFLPLDVNLVGTIMAVAVIVLLVGPRTALGVLVLIPLLTVLSTGATARDNMSRLPPPLTVAIALFATYVLLSAAWSAAPLQAIYTAAIGAFVLAANWAAIAGISLLPPERTAKFANAIVIGFALGMAFLFVEELTDDAIKLFFYKHLPFITRNPKHMVMKDQEVLNLAVYLSNRSMAAASLLLWPVLGILSVLLAGSTKKVWFLLSALTLFAASCVTVLMSQHETSAIALAVGGIAFLTAFAWRKFAFAMVAAGWFSAIALVIPVAHYAYDNLQLQKAQGLPFSARARVVIWKYTASRVFYAPVLGVGANATDELDVRRGAVAVLPDEPIALRTARHAHNIYLQVWYELGVAGAAFLLLIGASAIGAIRRLQTNVQPYALATFATSATMAATSWSLWQEWFMASFALAAAAVWLMQHLSTIAGEPADQSASPGEPPSSRLKSAAAAQ